MRCGLRTKAGRRTSSADQLTAACNLQRPSQLLDHFYANPERRYWAGQARVVFELAAAGDSAAGSIVDGAAADLANLVRTVHTALGKPKPPLPVVLGGGVLVHQPQLRDALAAGPHWRRAH